MLLLTPKEVARRLSVSPRTVYSWIAEGRLPAVHLSERITRVPEDAVDAFVEQSLATAPASLDAGPLVAAESTAMYAATTSVDADAMSARVYSHRDEILAAAEDNSLVNIRLFGSVVRGEASASSDVDMLVDPLPGCTLLNLTGFRLAVEDILGVAVDVVPARSVRPQIVQRVMAEARPL